MPHSDESVSGQREEMALSALEKAADALMVLKALIVTDGGRSCRLTANPAARATRTPRMAGRGDSTAVVAGAPFMTLLGESENLDGQIRRISRSSRGLTRRDYIRTWRLPFGYALIRSRGRGLDL